jgi:adenosine deaminase
MVEADHRFVGVNIAQPEDGPVSLRDYGLHMRILAFLKSRYPKVPMSLHAGELTLGLTPPRDLRFHIRDAVDVAGARRIGHGVDIAYEEGAVPLLARMARERIAVEINLTSNDVILGVKGAQHPLALYRAAGVPVVLSTDDPGVSRGDLTQEYMRAVTEQGLQYTDLRQISRDSLTYSFLEGESLSPACANARRTPSRACGELLQRSAKAREQWRLEQALVRFETALPGVLKSMPLR